MPHKLPAYLARHAAAQDAGHFTPPVIRPAAMSGDPPRMSQAVQEHRICSAMLAALMAMAPLTLPLATLRGAALAAGCRLPDAELLRLAGYLVASGHAAEKTDPHTGAKRWKLTDTALN